MDGFSREKIGYVEQQKKKIHIIKTLETRLRSWTEFSKYQNFNEYFWGYMIRAGETGLSLAKQQDFDSFLHSQNVAVDLDESVLLLVFRTAHRRSPQASEVS